MIIQNPEFLLLLPLLIYPAFLAYKKSGYARKITTARTVTMLVIIIAAASPAITQTSDAATQQKLNILKDNTTSMQAIQKPEISVQGNQKTFISGNNSQIFSQAAQNIEQGSENLLITDGQTQQTTNKLIREAKQKNASISIYTLREKSETSITIDGPSTTVPGAENTFNVEISSTKNKDIPVTITLNGSETYTRQINESYSFDRQFDTKGEYTIEAHINSTDQFSTNNHYYKTVQVREKPKILTIGSRGPLESNLEDFYNIETSQNIPENLEDYYTVIMKKKTSNSELENYLAEGNGLVYTASMKEDLPGYLPVRISSEDERDSGAKVVLLIDASFGTGTCVEGGEGFCFETSSKGGNAKESIQIAYSLVDSLKQNNKVGVLAYNRDSYLISRPKSLAFNRESLKQKISRISPSGPSFHDQGLDGATQFVESNDTVVMIADGEIGDFETKKNVPTDIRNIASGMEAKLITIGVGETPNKPLLQDIARTTGGYYLENNEAGRLNFKFGAGGGTSEYKPIAVVNPNHFITQGLELDGTVTGFNPVEVKRSADKLAAASNSQPVLSSWRYGLGRVAAFSADNKNLERLSNSDPALVSRTVSWSVGNPYRKKDDWENVKDASRPEKPVAKASYQAKGLNKQSKNLYSAEITANSLGFNQWNGETYAYNYNTEKQNIGQDMDKLQSIPQQTGGRIYDSENIGQLPKRLAEVDRKVEKQVSLAPYLISLALIMFLGEVGYRKRNGRL